jgi:hypothetical protein
MLYLMCSYLQKMSDYPPTHPSYYIVFLNVGLVFSTLYIFWFICPIHKRVICATYFIPNGCDESLIFNVRQRTYILFTLMKKDTIIISAIEFINSLASNKNRKMPSFCQLCIKILNLHFSISYSDIKKFGIIYPVFLDTKKLYLVLFKSLLYYPIFFYNIIRFYQCLTKCANGQLYKTLIVWNFLWRRQT